MKRVCFYLLLLLIICSLALIKADLEEDTWMDPDAWARDHLVSGTLRPLSGNCCKCLGEYYDHEKPATEQQKNRADDTASIIYFKKFVTMLFDRKNFKYDSAQQLYERSIVFSAELHQLDKLEKFQDPRDLDKILTEIFSNARTSNMDYGGQQLFSTGEISTGIKIIAYNIICDVWQLTKISEIRFLLAVIIVILIAWIIKNRYKIGWVPMVFGGIIIYGYFHTYLECNREIEVNQMLEILKSNEGSKQKSDGSKLIGFFKGIFYSNDDLVLQQKKILQSAKLSLGFCRPDHVFIMYINDIFIKYLQVLIEQCTVTITTLNSVLGFPYNIFSGFFVVLFIGYTLKLTFKYIFSPSAWAQFMYRKQSYHSEQSAIKNTTIAQGDRISGDNLKLLLSAANTAVQLISVAPTLSTPADGVSGVEDVREALETNLEKASSENCKSIDTKPENIKSNEVILHKENKNTNMENISESL